MNDILSFKKLFRGLVNEGNNIKISYEHRVEDWEEYNLITSVTSVNNETSVTIFKEKIKFLVEKGIGCLIEALTEIDKKVKS